jgi:hypothetical protein
MSGDEFVSEVNRLITQLRDSGEQVAGDSLDEALAFSSIATEVMGELKLRLHCAEVNSALECHDLTARVVPIRKYLDEQLPHCFR